MRNKLILFACLIFASSTSGQIMKEFNSLFINYDNPNLPGASVMVIKNGEIIFSKGYGIAVFEKMIPVTDYTNFRLASVTKQFTSMCILQLIEKGKLSFKTTLTEIFEGFPKYGGQITIKHLLQHTSGLVDYENLIPDTATIQVKDKDALEMMMNIDSVYFQPGEKYQYSNTGYALLSLTVAKISGLRFRDYLRKNIFTPLGMLNTLAFENGINEVSNRAFGYTIHADSVEFTDQSITSAVLGDGGVYSSINDLYKWDKALYTEILVKKELLDIAFTRGKLNNGDELEYGFGWRLEKYRGYEIVYHTGSTRGFRNILYRIPEQNFSVIILTNRNSGEEFSTLEIAHKVVDLFFNENN